MLMGPVLASAPLRSAGIRSVPASSSELENSIGLGFLDRPDPYSCF